MRVCGLALRAAIAALGQDQPQKHLAAAVAVIDLGRLEDWLHKRPAALTRPSRFAVLPGVSSPTESITPQNLKAAITSASSGQVKGEAQI